VDEKPPDPQPLHRIPRTLFQYNVIPKKSRGMGHGGFIRSCPRGGRESRRCQLRWFAKQFVCQPTLAHFGFGAKLTYIYERNKFEKYYYSVFSALQSSLCRVRLYAVHKLVWPQTRRRDSSYYDMAQEYSKKPRHISRVRKKSSFISAHRGLFPM
jgi:hypothetical protein